MSAIAAHTADGPVSASRMISSNRRRVLFFDEGKRVSTVARELDLVPSALGNWGQTVPSGLHETPDG